MADDKKIIIDEVEQVTDPSMRPDACPASNSFVAGTPVLLADGSTLVANPQQQLKQQIARFLHVHKDDV